MSEVFWWFVTGAGLAAIAVKALPVKDPDGSFVTVLLGIAGALLGGFLAVATGLAEFGETAAYIAAGVGSIASIGLKAWSVKSEQKASSGLQPGTPAKAPKTTARP